MKKIFNIILAALLIIGAFYYGQYIGSSRPNEQTIAYEQTALNDGVKNLIDYFQK